MKKAIIVLLTIQTIATAQGPAPMTYQEFLASMPLEIAQGSADWFCAITNKTDAEAIAVKGPEGGLKIYKDESIDFMVKPFEYESGYGVKVMNWQDNTLQNVKVTNIDEEPVPVKITGGELDVQVDANVTINPEEVNPAVPTNAPNSKMRETEEKTPEELRDAAGGLRDTIDERLGPLIINKEDLRGKFQAKLLGGIPAGATDSQEVTIGVDTILNIGFAAAYQDPRVKSLFDQCRLVTLWFLVLCFSIALAKAPQKYL